MLNTHLSKLDLHILGETHTLVGEELIEDRKGVPMSIYIIEVKRDELWNNYDADLYNLRVPEHLVGNWMMETPSDLRYTPVDEAIKLHRWVKCRRVEIVSPERREV